MAWTAIAGLALLSSAAEAYAACPKVGFTFVEPHPTAETRAVRIGRNQTIFVRRVPITTTSDIVELKLVADYDDGASLLIKFTPAAAQRLHDATTNQSGHWLAFMADDEVLVNSEWVGPYGMDADKGVRVSMNHGMKRGQRLMKASRGCIGAPAGKRTL